MINLPLLLENFPEFSFNPVHLKYVENIIKNILNNKTSGGEITLHILKQSGFAQINRL